MGIVIRFPRARRHARASVPTTGSGRRKACIGTDPPEKSLSRLARGSDGSLRPAKMFRRCGTEQPSDAAKSGTVIPFALAQRSMGCSLDMDASIPTGNNPSQQQTFPSGIGNNFNDLLRCCMGKRAASIVPALRLGAWLEFFGLGPTKVAEETGVSQPYISNLVAGRKKDPSALKLLLISRFLGVTVNDLYEEPPRRSDVEAVQRLSSQAQATILKRAAG